MPAVRSAPLRALLAGSAVLALTACENFDLDLRPGRADTTQAAVQATAPRPEADARGVISYPNYQVVVARSGDTVADVAQRIGMPADELARYNGIPADVTLRGGEILALPRRVGTGAADDRIDITTLAGTAIERADDGTRTITRAPVPSQSQPEPTRHKVKRGETAYSIARLYNVSVTALADWNGLGPDLEVREGQYLLIPVAAAEASAPAPDMQTSRPGAASAPPPPPSAARPLPEEDTKPAAAPATDPLPSPEMAQAKEETSLMGFPVQGTIIRGYEKGKNEGIDIAASAGTPVKAADAGTVAAITRDTEQVPILVLRHEGEMLTVYANIDNITVQKGDSVRRGQTVAEIRKGDPAFLHFEVRKGFESVDPMPFLQ